MRILNSGEPVEIPADELRPHPENPRVGDVDAVREAIRANGWHGALVVQQSTRRVLVGFHRWQAGILEGITAFPCLVVDVDDDEALRILLHDNRTADLGGYDYVALAELLAQLGDDGLAGTGYSPDDAAQIARAVNGDIGYSPEEAPPPDDGNPATTVFRVGAYTFPVLVDDYGEWLEDLRLESGFDGPSIKKEILCRLGIAT